MANNTKIYEIVINGLKEAFDNTVNLRNALNGLDGALSKSRSASVSYSAAVTETKKAKDDLIATEQKLNSFDEERQRAIEANKSVLKDYTDEVRQQVKEENAWATIQANNTATYRDKQKLMGALGTVIRNYNAVTEEEKAELESLKAQYASINSELKAFDKEMGNAYRNVGNYAEGVAEGIHASVGLKQELKQLKADMAVLADQGKKNSDEFKNMAHRASEITDAMGDVGTAIRKGASDAKAIDDVVGIAQTATGVFGLYTSTLAVFGEENEKVAESIKKLEAVQTALQSLQAVANQLTTDGTAVNSAYHLVLQLLGAEKAKVTAETVAETTAIGAETTAVGANTVATQAQTTAEVASTTAKKAGAVASRLLGTAMKSIPIMFIVGCIIALYQNFDKLVGWVKEATGVTGDFGGYLDSMKSIIMGVGNVIVKWLTNPIVTFAKVIKKIVSGDIKGAMKEVENGFTEQFKIAENFQEGYNKQEKKNADKRAQDNLKAEQKKTKDQLAELQARKGNEAKYSKEGQALMKKDFEQRKKLAKGNEEELRKIKNEELAYERECNDKKTASAKAAAQEASRIAKEEADRRQKLAEAEAKLREDSLNRAIETNKNTLETEMETWEILGNASRDYLSKMEPPINRDDFEDLQYGLSMLKVFNDSIKETINSVEKDGGTVKQVVEKLEKQFEKVFDDIKDENLKNVFKTLINETITSLDTGLGQAEISVNEKFKALRTGTENLFKDLKKIEGKGVTDLETIAKKMFSGTVDGYVDIDTFVTDLFVNMNKLDKNAINLFTDIEAKHSELAEKIEKKTADATDKQLFYLFNYILSYKTQLDSFNNAINKTATKASSTVEKSTKSITTTIKKELDEQSKALEGGNSEYDEFIEKYKEVTSKIANEGIFTKAFQKDNENASKLMLENFKFYVKEGKKNLKALEESWDKHIKDVANTYGKDSKEFEEAQKKKANAIKKFHSDAEKSDKEYQESVEKKMKDSAGDLRSDVASLGNAIVEIMASLFGEDFWKKLFGDNAETAAKAFGTTLKGLSMGLDAYDAWLDFAVEEAQEKVDQITKMYEDVEDKIDSTKDRISDINQLVMSAEGARKKALKEQLADEQTLLLQQQAEEARVRDQKAKAEEELAKKEKQQKKMSLATDMVMAVANTASSVAKTYADWGWPLGAVFGAIIGALGAVQIGIIGKQMSKLRDGGLIGEDGISRSHEQGGHKIYGTNIEVEGGEWVINKRSSAKYGPLLKAINEDDSQAVRRMSPYKYADGGQLDVVGIDRTLNNVGMEARLLDAINSIDMHPVVAVTDINKGQKNLVRVQQYSGRR